MLLDLGIHRAALLTNNPAKIKGLRSHGVEIVERLPVQVEPNPFNLRYLRTKKEKMGHLLPASILHGGLPDELSNGPADGAS
jgi:3,4-dihydroxy 2-butanone 4-phosphate synthase / GTP cyclohydrolase II